MIEKIGENFEILRKVGAGGMAQIYLAKNKDKNREEAIKVLSPNFQNDLDKRKRFKHEIRLLRKIDSPYVVRYYGGHMSPESCYLRMEYVDGHILKDYISKRSRLTVDETVEFSKQLALGFDEIHNSGVIHRDIKPQNIMIVDGARIKIVDFGISLDSDSERVTKTDMLIGTPHYVSPELIKQEEPTKESDIYALGIIMYEMLTGNVPFSGKDVINTLRMHENNELPRIATSYENVPIALENIIIKATSKNKHRRYKSMYELYKDLNVCLNDEHINDTLINLDGKKPISFESIINSKIFLIGLTFILVAIVAIIIFVLVTFK